MNTIEQLHNFMTDHLLGETEFFKFLWKKYRSHFYNYVGIERKGLYLSLKCDKYADKDGTMKPGFAADFEVVGRPGMFEITSHTPLHPECRKSTQDDPIHAARLDAAGTMLGVLQKDLGEYQEYLKEGEQAVQPLSE